MYSYHLEKKGLVTLAVTNRRSSRNFLYNADHLLVGWENNSTGEQKISRQTDIKYPGAFTCVHIIDPKVPGLIRQDGKFSIIDTYLDLAKTNDIYVYDHSGDLVVDVGKPESILKAEELFK
jgi:N-acetyl-alpha-D-muramate 1-phosphate uridylyltransferase